MSSRKEQKARAKAERIAREASQRAAARRKRLIVRASGAAAVLLAISLAVGIPTVIGGSKPRRPPASPPLRLASVASLGRLASPGPPGPLGPEGVSVPSAPDLAARTASGAKAAPVDGIQCLGAEQVVFHIHVHLTVFVHGRPRRIPYGIGIRGARVSSTPNGLFVGTGTCFYWLHTHAADGIIHIESPVERAYTLGDFFDVWGQKLGPARVGPFSGRVTALYDGRRYEGDPRGIPLTAHAQLQLEVGTPLVASDAIAFPGGL